MVALKAKRSIGYIVNKVIDAIIGGIYSPNTTECDKHLTFLILQLSSGPGLLDIVHRAINLPSTSTAYRDAKGLENHQLIIDSYSSIGS